MTERSLFWIEPAKVTGLLATVSAPTMAEPMAVPMVPASTKGNSSVATDPVATDFAALGEPATRTLPPNGSSALRDCQASRALQAPLHLPRRPLEARLAALLEWLEAGVEFEEAFVIDADGLPLIESAPAIQNPGDQAPGATAELVAAAAAFGRTWQELRRSAELDARTSITLELPRRDGDVVADDRAVHRRLYLLPGETRWGMLQLGFVTERRLGTGALSAARDAFSRTVDDKEYDRS